MVKSKQTRSPGSREAHYLLGKQGAAVDLPLSGPQASSGTVPTFKWQREHDSTAIHGAPTMRDPGSDPRDETASEATSPFSGELTPSRVGPTMATQVPSGGEKGDVME